MQDSPSRPASPTSCSAAIWNKTASCPPTVPSIRSGSRATRSRGRKTRASTCGGKTESSPPFGHEFERNLYFQLLSEQGGILLRSPSAPSQPLGALAPGFNSVTKDNHEWRTFTLYNQDAQTWLIVAERDDERSELASKMATLTMLPLLITLPFLLGLLWWLISRGLAPLRQLAQAIGERHPANLSPLNLKIRAQELTPLTNEINRLMHALADTIEREKQFTNEAAHELRTPLAVLRIHSENALAAEDAESRQHSLQKMLLALDRSDRLLRQLLTQARIDNQQGLELSELNLNQLLQGTLATLAPIALKKDQQLSLEGTEQLTVMGQATLLELMFSNLIDNALRYTQAQGEIVVEACQEGHRVRVDIRDNGPGIPTAALSRLCERFFRVNPQQGDGVGLGMAIVSRIAQLHGADLDIHNRPEGGLEVSVLLPSRTPSPP